MGAALKPDSRQTIVTYTDISRFEVYFALTLDTGFDMIGQFGTAL
jgi:hypothetical protein